MIGPFTGQWEFLSNFYPAAVDYEGDAYPAVEHAFQAARSMDPAERRIIRVARTPREARALGGGIEFARPDWERVKVDIMFQLVWQKFHRHKDPRDKLLATGNELIADINHTGDTFWGAYKGEGGNRLGKILMHVRAGLRRKLPS